MISTDLFYARLITLSGIFKEGILLLVRSGGTTSSYRGRECHEHSSKNPVSSPDIIKKSKKSRNLSFTQYNSQYEEQEKKKQKRDDNLCINASGRGSSQNNNAGSVNNIDKDISVSRGTNISSMKNGSHTGYDQNSAKMPSDSKLRCGGNDRNRTEEYDHGNSNWDSDEREAGIEEEREVDGCVETWAMSLIGK